MRERKLAYVNSEDCSAAALAGTPRPTEDVGDFLPLEGWSGTVWRERDPDGTLEEEWERVDAGDGRFLAVRCPTHGAVLVVAGAHFGYAQDSGDRANGSGRPVTLRVASPPRRAGRSR